MHANCQHRCGGKFWKIGILVIAGIAVLGLVVMLLWNWLMPALFESAHPIGYLQALGLLVLSKILFGGLRGHGRWHRHHRWHAMSVEERAKFQSGTGCCGGKCADSSEVAAPVDKAE
jgi:hypothetical protein